MDNNFFEDNHPESIIFFSRWFDCMKAQGPRNFAKAMDALFSYVFHGEPISGKKLPKSIESILNAFLPVIETNCKKKMGGKKGTSYGERGGRPTKKVIFETPMGLSKETPMGFGENDNESEKEKCVCNYDDTDTAFFLPVFFFKNLMHPETETEKFINFYRATSWQLPGGKKISSATEKIALAKRWRVENPRKRFSEEDLDMWKNLYSVAPEEIKPFFLDSGIKIIKGQENAKIFLPEQLFEWLENDETMHRIRPIVRHWLGNKTLFYQKYQISRPI